MNRRWETLCKSAAADGASCPPVVALRRADESDDVDRLLEAWYRERTGHVECSLALDQARRLISGMLAEGSVTPHRRRQADRLIRVIRNLQDAERGDRRA
jgi:hypothetical protein